MVKTKCNILLLWVLIFAYGCFSSDTLKKQEMAKADAQYVMDNLNTEEVKSHFPVSKFPLKQTDLLLGQLSSYCDWAHRKGKFVDQTTINSNGRNYIAFIYEYFLKCDSARFILIYDLGNEKPELGDFKIEKLTKDNPLIIDKEKELLNSK